MQINISGKHKKIILAMFICGQGKDIDPGTGVSVSMG